MATMTGSTRNRDRCYRNNKQYWSDFYRVITASRRAAHVFRNYKLFDYFTFFGAAAWVTTWTNRVRGNRNRTATKTECDSRMGESCPRRNGADDALKTNKTSQRVWVQDGRTRGSCGFLFIRCQRWRCKQKTH